MASEKTGSFVLDYIQECIETDILTPNDICDRVKNEIAEIDQKLHESDGLRIRKMNLSQVLTHYGMALRRQASLAINADIDDNSEEFISLQKSICELIDQNGAMTNREIIQGIGKYQEDAKIIRAIKNLGEQEVLAKDGSPENRLVKGDKWDNRP